VLQPQRILLGRQINAVQLNIGTPDAQNLCMHIKFLITINLLTR